MRGLRTTLLVFVIICLALVQNSFQMAHSDRDRFIEILDVLNRSSSGRIIIEKAKIRWGFEQSIQLLEYLKWGSVSKTDAVLTRQFDPVSGKEKQNREVT